MKASRAGAAALRLYYYTGKQWGIKALWEKRLKIVRLSDLNSPFEVMPFNADKKAARRYWHEQVASMAEEPSGFICLSEDWRSTLMWSHYGEKHAGICLGFDVPRIEAIRIRYLTEPMAAPQARRRSSSSSAHAARRHAVQTSRLELRTRVAIAGAASASCRRHLSTGVSTTRFTCARSSWARVAR